MQSEELEEERGPVRSGPFRPGDRVQLTDPKGRHFSLVLERGQSYHTHRGAIDHDKLIGAPEGSVVHSAANTPYLALRPLLPDYVLAMPRGAQVIADKGDAAGVGGDVGACGFGHAVLGDDNRQVAHMVAGKAGQELGQAFGADFPSHLRLGQGAVHGLAPRPGARP